MRIRPLYTAHGLRLQVANLHALLGERWVHPIDPKISETIAQVADLCWEVGLATKRSPHLCMDRYCECHLVLAEAEPPRLPGLE